MTGIHDKAMRYFLLTFAFILLIPSYLHGDLQNEGRSNADNILSGNVKLQTIIVDNYYPYTFANKDNIPDGFSVDLMKAVTQAMNMELEISVGTWDKARNALETGEIDFLPMMAYSTKRDKVFDFSVPHTIAFDGFFTRKDSDRIRSIDNLHNKSIIVMNNDQAHDYLRSLDFISSEQLILIDSLPEALRLLASGKGDTALMPKLVGLIFIRDLKLTNLEPSPIVVKSYKRPFSFSVKEGNLLLLEKLSQGLRIVKETDQYKAIYEKWFGTLEPPGLSLTTVLYYSFWIFLAFILIGAILVLWSFSLRRQVALRTKSLEAEIHERKQAETKLKDIEISLRNSNTLLNAVMDGTTDTIFLKDLDGKYVLANKSTLQALGKTINEVIGKDDSELFPSDSFQVINNVDASVLETGKAQLTEEKLETAYGNTYWLSNKSPYLDKDGKVIGLIGISRNITERKQLEEEIQKIHKLESIGILAGGIAHDFNNLLAAIRNNIYLSKMYIDRDNNAYEPLESTEYIIHRATNLTQQLLIFSKGGTPVKKTASITDFIMESAEFVLRGSNVKCEYSVADNLWPVEVDEGQINQVLHNIILNATQSMPKGGTIRISAENSYLGSDIGLPLQEGNYVKIVILDRGVGIAEEDLKNVFDPYFTTKEMGRGLGLSITYSIIKNHNGHISVESETGVGTSFTIYLPASEKSIEVKESADDIFIAGKGKILLMDDEEIIRDSVSILLTQYGYEVECVENGDEAIALYRKNMKTSQSYDAVILDLTIRGGMGGKEAVMKLLEIDPDVKAIVSSGYSSDPVLANFKEYGFCGVFAKPARTEELGKILHKVINEYK